MSTLILSAGGGGGTCWTCSVLRYKSKSSCIGEGVFSKLFDDGVEFDFRLSYFGLSRRSWSSGCNFNSSVDKESVSKL